MARGRETEAKLPRVCFNRVDCVLATFVICMLKLGAALLRCGLSVVVLSTANRCLKRTELYPMAVSGCVLIESVVTIVLTSSALIGLFRWRRLPILFLEGWHGILVLASLTGIIYATVVIKESPEFALIYGDCVRNEQRPLLLSQNPQAIAPFLPFSKSDQHLIYVKFLIFGVVLLVFMSLMLMVLIWSVGVIAACLHVMKLGDVVERRGLRVIHTRKYKRSDSG